MPRFLSARAYWVCLAAALAGCGFPDYQYTDENCFNGIDDDGNGLVDCDDPGCQPVTQCVEAAPTADGWAGPVTIWQGSDPKSAPSCGDTHYSHTLFDTLSANPQKGRETCPTCTCKSTPSANAPQCFARLQISSNPGCGGGTQELMYADDNQPGFPVGPTCTAINVDLSKFNPQTIFLRPPYVVDDSCVPTETGPTVIDPPTFETSLKACDLTGATMPGGCGAKQTCAPKPSADFTQYVCIYKQSDGTNSPCPDSYYNTKLVFSEYKDDRTCTPCTCTPGNETCVVNGPVPGLYYDDQFCSAGGNYIQQTPSCQGYPLTPQGKPTTTIYAKLTNTSISGAGGTCEANPGAIQDGITAQKTYTFCCTSIN